MDVREAVPQLTEQGPLCNTCLGRVFADRSYGLTNTERGKALRITLALEDDYPYEPPDDCWVCDTESTRVDEWATWAANELMDIDFETYQVGTRLSPLIEESDKLLREDAGLPPDRGEPFNRELNREVGKRIGDRLDRTVDMERPDVVVLIDLTTDRLTVTINPAFVYGRYHKHARGIPQTEWPCRECDGTGTIDGTPCAHCDGTGFLYDESIESLISPHVNTAMSGTGTTFHGAGREDIDARMLGTGRPFVVEVANPTQRFPDLDALATTINTESADKVSVTDLALATHEMVERVKELPATKTYRVTVEFDREIDPDTLDSALHQLTDITIDQHTPTRVAHRRADRTRTRHIHEITGDLDTPGTATITTTTEGGLYIKELMHGDAGRTTPSLAGLLDTTVSVTALDVIAVEAESGDFADPAFLRSPRDSS